MSLKNTKSFEDWIWHNCEKEICDMTPEEYKQAEQDYWVALEHHADTQEDR